MKLSEAIRLGAMLKPQGTGAKSAGKHARATCAIGAALDAVSAERNEVSAYTVLMDLWPVAMAVADCPVSTATGERCGHSVPRDVGEVAWMLNDWHEWPREQIADWVETIEAQQAQQGEADGAVLELREVITLAQKVSA